MEERMEEKFENLKGKIFRRIDGLEYNSERVKFFCEDDSDYELFHTQDCCETVTVDEIEGDVEYILGSEILLAEEVSTDDPHAVESGTWTFYKLATLRGYVTIKWYGSSNGYYSEEVYFSKVVRG